MTSLDAATVDLLGVLAYGELMAFERMAADGKLAPSLEDKIELQAMAHAEYGHFEQICEALRAAGIDPIDAMKPFRAAIDAFHDATQPSDWYEGLIKAYVGDGMAADFYREVARFVTDESVRALVIASLADTGQAEFAVRRIKQSIVDDPALGGRLALWARRLVGEALLQAQQVAVERDALLQLLVGSGDLAGISRLFATITERHTERMGALGLQA
jgi:hypothetical protein